MSGKKGGEAKRQQIMRAAEDLFADRRYHELTLDEVAQRARVGKGTIYRYFKDKDDLFLQTMGWGFDQLCESLQALRPGRGGLKKALLDASRRLGEFYHQRWQLMRMIQAEEHRRLWSKKGTWQGWLERRKKLNEILARLISAAGKGELRREIKPPVLAALLHQLARPQSPVLWEMEREKRYKLVVELLCHGAAAEREGR